MELINRAGWGADPGSLPEQAMTLPARELWLHHTVTAVTDDPIADMKAVERVGLGRFGIVSYSFCIHPSGVVLEGAGFRRGAHTERRNSTSFGVAWIGNYQELIPTAPAMDTHRELTARLIRDGHLRPGVYPTGGHRDLKATACPGNQLYAAMDDLRIPWAEPGPADPAVTDFPEGEDHMRRYDIRIGLDGDGNGHTAEPLDFPPDRVVSLVAHGPWPPADGYQPIPTLGRQMRDEKTAVTAEGGPPDTTVPVTIWVLA